MFFKKKKDKDMDERLSIEEIEKITESFIKKHVDFTDIKVLIDFQENEITIFNSQKFPDCSIIQKNNIYEIVSGISIRRLFSVESIEKILNKKTVCEYKFTLPFPYKMAKRENIEKILDTIAPVLKNIKFHKFSDKEIKLLLLHDQ